MNSLARRRKSHPAPRVLSALMVGVAVAVGAGCSSKVQGPADPGVCWQMVHPKGKPVHFNRVSQNVPNLETCAAQLEALRIKFIQLGGSHLNIAGVYQGQFIFIRHDGVFTSTELDGMTYLALVRTGDGRLAVPGARLVTH